MKKIPISLRYVTQVSKKLWVNLLSFFRNKFTKRGLLVEQSRAKVEGKLSCAAEHQFDFANGEKGTSAVADSEQSAKDLIWQHMKESSKVWFVALATNPKFKADKENIEEVAVYTSFKRYDEVLNFKRNVVAMN